MPLYWQRKKKKKVQHGCFAVWGLRIAPLEWFGNSSGKKSSTSVKCVTVWLTLHETGVSKCQNTNLKDFLIVFFDPELLFDGMHEFPLSLWENVHQGQQVWQYLRKPRWRDFCSIINRRNQQNRDTDGCRNTLLRNAVEEEDRYAPLLRAGM